MKKITMPSAFTIILFCFAHFVSAQVQYGTFKLIDANTDTVIRTFDEDITHYLSEADSLNILAEPINSYTQIRFTSSDSYTRTEGTAPYAYYGDVNGDYGFVSGQSGYFGWAPALGELEFTIEYLISGVVQATDTFTITFEQSPPSSGSSVWTQTGSNIHYTTGNVGIGTATPGTYKLAVNGNIRAKEVKVESNWADYVFEKEYQLPTLEEVEQHILEKGHLINIPSAAEVQANGIELGDMNRLLLEKIEELTLYLLQQQQEIQNLKKELKEIKLLQKEK